MTNDRETENARERLAVRLRETLGAAVREIRPSPQDGIALDVFAGSLPDVAAALQARCAITNAYPSGLIALNTVLFTISTMESKYCAGVSSPLAKFQAWP